jgi:hypothetical protein
MSFTLNKVVLTTSIADISTAGQVYVAIPEEFEGDVVEIRTVLNGAISTADATITPKINGIALTNGAVTVAQSGSAAGDVDVSRPSGNNTVRAGDAIEFETDGASTGAVELGITFVILR